MLYPFPNRSGQNYVAVCDTKEDRAKAMAEKYGCRYYTDYQEMIRTEKLDAVHLSALHYLHPEMAILCDGTWRSCPDGKTDGDKQSG